MARPTRPLATLADLHVRGLHAKVIGAFEDLDGYRIVLQHAAWER